VQGNFPWENALEKDFVGSIACSINFVFCVRAGTARHRRGNANGSVDQFQQLRFTSFAAPSCQAQKFAPQIQSSQHVKEPPEDAELTAKRAALVARIAILQK
jgi:hypothetical protein